MKKMLTVISLVCLFSSCDEDYLTEHFFSVSNLSSDTLELHYQAINMESLIDTIIPPCTDKGFRLMGNFTESGKEDFMNNEVILNHFILFKFIKETDTIQLNNATLSKWLIRHDGGVDSGCKSYSYGIEITDQNLK